MLTMTFWQTYHQSILTLAIIFAGALVAWGRLISTMLTKTEFKALCDSNQDKCYMDVSRKIEHVHTSIRELKMLVIDLHDKQTEKIEAMDSKREDAKKISHAEMIEITKALGRVEGQVGSMAQGRRSFSKN